MKDLIVAENIVKEYCEYEAKKFVLEKVSSTIAVNNISMKVQEGDFIAIMGGSGSGKSTLINILSSMDIPTSGKVLIEGKSLKSMTQKEIAMMRYKTIGFVFQNFNLIDLLTCKENIGVPLLLNNVKKEEIDKRVRDIAKTLNIENILDKYPKACSGGERQRVATGRALISEPKIIIADEPTGNLDSENSKRVMEFFRKINKEKNIAILMVTHDSLDASYADKVMYLRDGKIENSIMRGEKSQKEFFEDILIN